MDSYWQFQKSFFLTEDEIERKELCFNDRKIGDVISEDHVQLTIKNEKFVIINTDITNFESTYSESDDICYFLKFMELIHKGESVIFFEYNTSGFARSPEYYYGVLRYNPSSIASFDFGEKELSFDDYERFDTHTYKHAVGLLQFIYYGNDYSVYSSGRAESPFIMNRSCYTSPYTFLDVLEFSQSYMKITHGKDYDSYHFLKDLYNRQMSKDILPMIERSKRRYKELHEPKLFDIISEFI